MAILKNLSSTFPVDKPASDAGKAARRAHRCPDLRHMGNPVDRDAHRAACYRAWKAGEPEPGHYCNHQGRDSSYMVPQYSYAA